MDDINLDFLTTPPRHEHHLERIPTPVVSNRIDIAFGNKKSHKKKLEIAQKLEKIDNLVREIETLKLDNNELQKQLKDFQKAAQQVQHLYNEEKQQNEQIKKDFNHLKQQYDKVDIELASKTMQYVQLEARLAEYEGRPIDYDSLVIKFIRIIKKLERDDCLRYCHDKGLVEELTQYCINMKLKLPVVKSPQKLKPRSVKSKKQDVSVQCSIMEVHHVPICKAEMKEQYIQTQLAAAESFDNLEKHTPIRTPDLKEQYTQCQVAMRDQASQYISTMITRQTNTEKVMQRHISTMFPEPKPTPPINDILGVFCKWADIRSITPLEDSQIKETSKSLNSTGTCTMLCNIRRKIDYLPLKTSNIKQELTTPSPSPIPTSNTTSATASNRSRLNNNISQTSASIPSNINNQNNSPNAILTLLNATSNSALGQLSATAFNELWQIFGTMLLSLLQTSNTGVANINHNSINQQQFLDWLLDLYISSQLSSNNTRTPSMSQEVNSTQTSPLRFNNSSVLSASNIIRPQAVKSVNKQLLSSRDNNFDEQSELMGNNHNYGPNASTSPTPPYTSGSILGNFSHDSDSTMDREIQQIQTSANIIAIQTATCESNANQLSTNEIFTIKSQKNKTKNKRKIEKQIHELFPEVKLNKNKRKALKRLLNDTKKKIKKKKPDNIIVNEETSGAQHIETAVDFLKVFAQVKGNFENNELNFKESEAQEKEIIAQIPISYEESLAYPNSDHYLQPLTNSSNNDFTFIKPHNLQQTTKSIKDDSNNTFIKPAQKLKQSKLSTSVENKYQMLFGDSDSEIDDEEEIPRLNENSVITAIEIVANDINNVDGNSEARNSEQHIEGEQNNCVELKKAVCEQSCFNFPISNSFTNVDQTSQQMHNDIFLDNTNQGKLLIPEIGTPLLENLENTSPFSNTNDIFFKKMIQENQTSVNNLTGHRVELQLTNTEINSTQACVKVSTDIEKDLKLSSDDKIIKEDNHMKCELLSSNNQTYAAENEIEECQNVLYNFNSLPNLQDTYKKYKQDTKTSKINNLCTNYNNLDVLYSIKSPTVINNDTTKIRIEPKENHILNLEDNSNNIQQTKRTETGEQAKSELRLVHETYASDFEKDFELSSDNESELTEVDNQFHNDNKFSDNGKSKSNHNDNSLPAIKASENNHNMKNSLEDLKQEVIRGFKQNHKSLVTQQKNFSSDSLTEPEENIIPFTERSHLNNFKHLSSQNSILTRTEHNLRDCDTLESIPSTESEKSLTSPKGSQNIEQDSKGFDEQQWEKYNTPKTEPKLKANENLQNGALRKSAEKISPGGKHLSKIVNSFQNRENNIKSTSGNDSLKPLPDFNNTFIQKRNLSNTETISKLTNEKNLHNTDQLKICENSSNDDDITQSTTHSCCPVIPVTDTTESSYRHSSTSEDEEISIIEISSDVTALDNKRQLESPVENDLIIDEDSNDIPNEENELEIEASSHEYLNCQERIVEGFIGEDHNYYQTNSKELNSKKLNEIKIDEEEIKDDTLNTTNISSILDSSLYNEILTDSIKPIVNDFHKYNDILTTPSLDGKAKRGRKRKSEYSSPDELLQTCKRSQRLKAKQIVLEQSINVSAIPIEIGKYTQIPKKTTEKIKMKNLNQMKPKEYECVNEEINANDKELKNNLPLIQMGFFKERVVEEDSNKGITSFNNEINIKLLNPTKNPENLKTITNCELKNNSTSIQMDFFSQDKAEKNIGKEILLNESCIKKPSGTDIKQNILMQSNEDTYMENSNQTLPSYENDTPEKNILNTAFCKYSESPKSPPPFQNNDDILNKTCIIIPLEREPEDIPQHGQRDDTMFDKLINNYATQQQKNIQPHRTKALKNDLIILQNLEKELQLYCYNEMELDPDHTALKLINKLFKITDNYDLIQKALLKTAQNATSLKVPESELPSIIQEMPPRHLSSCLQRLFVVLRHILHKNFNFCKELILKIESLLFDTQQADKLSLEATLNLTQFYLLTCKQKETLDISKYPARIFIAKCLYYYNKKAKLMVHEVLLWYPTVLPHREDSTYDRSDALITVIQELLMNTKYDMNNQELRDRTLLSKLRYEYHFEPFKPSLDEVIANLVEKLANSKFYNLSLAFGLLCKRLEPKKVQEVILQTHLLPLASQYYNKALNTLEYDKRISVLLEIISIIVKPFPLHTNVEVYLNEFSRFLNGFDRPVIQEAALCSILHLQRFGCVNCYNLFRHFKPNYNLNPLTQAKLKTFVYRKSLNFWKTIRSQNPKN